MSILPTLNAAANFSHAGIAKPPRQASPATPPKEGNNTNCSFNSPPLEGCPL